MENSSVKINKLLYPLSWLYGAGVWVRNKLFDWGVIKSRTYGIPVICVGNITVGGTGKTPHTEYLVRLLKDEYDVAVLSRGYKRKTKGFVLADRDSDANTIGDEPKQIKDKFGDITVAVDESRCHGIDTLMAGERHPEVIILDDAYQHRYVKAGLTILLTSYERLLTEDAMLPAGRLREQASEKHRADIIVITKCPDDMNPIDYRIITNKINPYPYQELFFSTFVYGQLENIVTRKVKRLDSITKDDNILLLTGIANPGNMARKISSYTRHIESIRFDDHHNFSSEDIDRIRQTFNNINAASKYIITTEKDAARIRLHAEQLADIMPYIYTLPIEVSFLLEQENKFNQIIIDYVRKNTGNSSIS